MKIVVYNSYGQYALSRAELEAVLESLPRLAWACIQEFHLAHSHPRYCEAFEYDAASRIAYLIFPVAQKTEANRADALAALLVGIARIQAGSRFFRPLKPKELAEYGAFVSTWLPHCKAAIVRLHERA